MTTSWFPSAIFVVTTPDLLFNGPNDLPSVIYMTTLIFADDVEMVSARPQSDLPQFHSQWQELVGKLGASYQSHRMPLNCYWKGTWHFNYQFQLEVLAVSYTSQSLLTIYALSRAITSHPLYIPKRLPPKPEAPRLVKGYRRLPYEGRLRRLGLHS